MPRGLGAIPPRFNDEITGAREVDGSTKTFRKSLTLPDTHVPAGAPPYRGNGLAGILVPAGNLCSVLCLPGSVLAEELLFLES